MQRKYSLLISTLGLNNQCKYCWFEILCDLPPFFNEMFDGNFKSLVVLITLANWVQNEVLLITSLLRVSSKLCRFLVLFHKFLNIFHFKCGSKLVCVYILKRDNKSQKRRIFFSLSFPSSLFFSHVIFIFTHAQFLNIIIFPRPQKSLGIRLLQLKLVVLTLVIALAWQTFTIWIVVQIPGRLKKCEGINEQTVLKKDLNCYQLLQKAWKMSQVCFIVSPCVL